MEKLDILSAPFIREMCEVTANMYDHIWDERNGGNISYLLLESEVSVFLDTNKFSKEIPLGFVADPIVRNQYFLVTGTGKYFCNG